VSPGFRSLGASPLSAGLLAGLLWGCGRPGAGASVSAPPTPAPALTPVTLGLDWYPEIELGGFYQAQLRGYYRQAGLDVRFEPGGTGAHPIPRLATGDIQFGLLASDEVIIDVAHHLPIAVVGAFLQHVPVALLIHDESPVRTFADLNHRVVVSVPGAGWVVHVQHKYHVAFDVVPMSFEIGRFLADPTVIQQCYATNEPYYVAKAGVKARVLLVSASGYDPYRVILTNRSFLRQHPETVRAFVAASLRGWNDLAYGDASATIDQIVGENTKVDRDFVATNLQVMRANHIISGTGAERVGQLSRERLASEIQQLADIKAIDAPYPVDDLASFAFSPEGLPPPEAKP